MSIPSLRRGITVTIASGSSVSDALQMDADARRTWDLMIVAPGTITGTPAILQHSLDNSTFGDLAVVGVSSQLKVSQAQPNVINGIPGVGYLRVTATVTQTAAKTFQFYGIARPGAI